MKKIKLLAVSLFLVTAAFAQDVPKHRGFLSAGVNWMPGYQPWYSVEGGIMGISSPTSFSATADLLVEDGDIAYLVGAKAYYSVYRGDKISYLVYIGTKISPGNGGALEFGFNPNYKLSNDWLLGVTLANMVMEDEPLNIFAQIKVAYLFRKKQK